MQEEIIPRLIPVKMYRTEDRLTVAAPMPGMEAPDITAEVTADGRLILDGTMRGYLKGIKDLLLDEWSVGPYHRELALPCAVDGTLANVTYGNGVLTVALPVSDSNRPAALDLDAVGAAHGERAGNAGHPVRPRADRERGAPASSAPADHGAPEAAGSV